MHLSGIKKPIVGFVLSLISGILIFINAIILVIFASVIHTFIITFDIIHYGRIRFPFEPPSLFILSLAIVGIVCGIVIILASYLTYKGKIMLGGIFTLIFSILSIIVGGGFFIGMVFGIIGGILSLLRI
ncbi:MAG: hypothetical protein QXW83_04250 [Nitrososphaerales archaeon]